MKISNAARNAIARTPDHVLQRMRDATSLTEAMTDAEVVLTFQRDRWLVVDGYPGTATLAALWRLYKPDRDAAILRAREAARTSDHTIYTLGAGSYDWFAEEVESECDCSGLVAHILGRSRKPAPDWKLGGKSYWFSTDSIHTDATKYGTLFKKIPKPVDGCFAVYPDTNGHQGHVAFILDAESMHGIDCSSSQYRRHGDAIRERGLTFFLRKPAAVFCVPTWWE